MGSFLSRTLIMVFGYTYPAYESFKVVEKKENADVQQLLFWCQYWILVALFSVCERIGDKLISWLPMYSVAKLAVFIYLWHPKSRGALNVHKIFLEPFMSRHKTEIDRKLLELRVKAGEIAFLLWKNAWGYGQGMLSEAMNYVSSQSRLQPSRGQQVQDEGNEVDTYSPVPNPSRTDLPQTEELHLDSSIQSLNSHDEKGPENTEIESASLISKKQSVSRKVSPVTGKWKMFRTTTKNR